VMISPFTNLFVGSLESSHHSTMLNPIPAYIHFV
jgi:hypothetical protein